MCFVPGGGEECSGAPRAQAPPPAGGHGRSQARVACDCQVHTDFELNHKDRIISFLTKGGKHHTEGGLQGFADPRGSAYHDIERRGITPAMLRASRIQVVNVWRGAEEFPLRRMPLAVADARSIEPTEWVSTNFASYTTGNTGRVFPLVDGTFPTAHAGNAAKHKWYYFPVCLPAPRERAPLSPRGAAGLLRPLPLPRRP